ncbi:MAG: PilZ domain-containing protein [Deltaproteobacteria bacterium]|nr:MAG: PilZ domain-containing protein [Deltaproteobacteria bacterium]
MGEERYALAFDDGGSSLGPIALRLIRLGIDVLYAKTLDEAWLLAKQEGPRIGALLFPPGVDTRGLARVSSCAHGARDGGGPSLIAVGESADAATRARLREAGVGWAVWEPGDDAALRFAVNAATLLPSEILPRGEPRAAISLLASFFVGEERTDAVLYTLSTHGAFLETPRPAPKDAEIALELWLADELFETRARVVYANVPGEQRCMSWPVGMGVVFEELDPEMREYVRHFVEERAECFAV